MFLNMGRLSAKVYYKPNNTVSFPLGTSYVPSQIQRSIAIGEMTRLLRNTVDPSIYEHYQCKLTKHFAEQYLHSAAYYTG